MIPDASARLRAELLSEIEARGPIPFARFMELCLYHPRHGYYTRGIGGGGGRDYLTGSGTHRAFGALVARQAEEMWRRLGCPSRFTLVEYGPGEGTFAADLLHEAARFEAFAGCLEVLLVEPSPALRARQRARLAAAPVPIAWADEADLDRRAEGVTGLLFANEVLDAFPVHRVIGTAAGPREIHVAARDGALTEVVEELSDPDLTRFMERAGIDPEEGQEVDLNLAAPRFVARAVGRLRRGYAVFVDYGHEARELYHPGRRRGTLLAYHRHRFGEDYLRLPGEQDLTAHVDFTAVRSAAEGAAARCLGIVSQSRFLLALGALDFFAALPDGAGGAPGTAGILRDREALKDLVHPGGMGERFRVMILARGEVPEELTGLCPPWESGAAAAGGRPAAGAPTA